MLAFVWNAAVFPDWGTALLSVTAAIVAMHLMLPLRRVSWGRRAVLSLIAAILVGGLMMSFGPLHRPFDLFRANLSDQWLWGEHLKGANLGLANLKGATLAYANLSGAALVAANLSLANLTEANLTEANLSFANLTEVNLSSANLPSANLKNTKLMDAKLYEANLIDANLTEADLRKASFFSSNLTGANLTGANLSGATVLEVRGLIQEQLDKACGDNTTTLPPGLTLRKCD
jgi:hypothetical protein